MVHPHKHRELDSRVLWALLPDQPEWDVPRVVPRCRADYPLRKKAGERT